MKISVGSLLATVTLIGSILIGGANFGELRSATKVNSAAIFESRILNQEVTRNLRDEMKEFTNQLRLENMETLKMVAQMSTDIRWMKELMSRREQTNNNK